MLPSPVAKPGSCSGARLCGRRPRLLTLTSRKSSNQHWAPPLTSPPANAKPTSMFAWQNYLAVMAGGATGAALRMAISGSIAKAFGATFPWGTFVVNVSGCFLIGIFAAATGPDSPLLVSPLVRQTIMIGLLGGYTTFSSFSLQTLELLHDGQWLPALGNAAGSLITCLLATWLGLALSNLLLTRPSAP